MRDVVVLGVGMTPFGKFMDRNMKSLAHEAVNAALADAGIEAHELQAAYVGNALAGLITGQENIRGQVVLGAMGIGRLPVYNVENACAASSCALGLGWTALISGQVNCVLALGVEKMTHPDKARIFAALASSVDVEKEGVGDHDGSGHDHSVFMDYYANLTRSFMARTGVTRRHLAWIAAKNHDHGALNPYAQYQFGMTVQEVLDDRVVAGPLTRSMCSPIADGAAAAILCTAEFARRVGGDPVQIRSFALQSAVGDGQPAQESIVASTASKAYNMANLGPEDLDVVEVHDATATGELTAYPLLGLCTEETIIAFIEAEHSRIGGLTPVNPSGGLESRGHPVGATGLAQIAELTWQLRGQAGARQVQGARVGLAQNSGGLLNGESAACAVTILSR